MILGAVLAGGKSSRFGSDKALALLDGEPLIELAARALARSCEAVVVVGREAAPVPGVALLPDWPQPDLGPLGGLAAALRHACREGYEAVLTCAVDAAVLPDDLLEILQPAPACLDAQPVIGLWPASLASAVEPFLASNRSRSVYRFAELVGARRVVPATPVPNINTPDDLAELARRG